MARHQASGSEIPGSEHVRLTGPRDGSSPRRDALAAPAQPKVTRSGPARAWIGIGVAFAVLLLLIVVFALLSADT
jgi:hypothetical protein